MQPRMAGTLQSKGRDDLGSTQTPLMILVFIKCSKSSRPSFSSPWPREPGRQSCVEGCPCCHAPVHVKNRCLQSCEGCSSEIVKMAGRVHGKVSMSAGTVWPSGLRRWLQAPVRKGVGYEPHSCHFLCLCRDMQPHMAGTLQSKGRDDLGIFSTQTPLMILVFIKCSKSSRPSFSSPWPREPGRQSCVEGCPCCHAPVHVKNRCLQSCEL